MNTGLSTISNILLPNVGAAPAISKPVPTQNGRKSASTPDGSPSPNTVSQATETDNTPPLAHKKPSDTESQAFQPTLDRKTADKKPQQAQDGPESKEQTPAPGLPGGTQELLAALVTENTEKTNAATANLKGSYEPAQLLTGPKTDEASPATKQTTESVQNSSTLTTGKNQPGTKTASPNTPNKQLSNTNTTAVTDVTEKTPGPNKPLTAPASPTQQADIKMPTTEAATKDDNAGGEKITTPNQSTVSDGLKTPPSNDKTLVSQTTDPQIKTPDKDNSILGDTGEKPTTEQANPNNPKTAASNTAPHIVQDKSATLQQKTPDTPENPSPVTEKSARNGQQNPTIPEPRNDNAATQTDNPAGNTVSQKLSQIQAYQLTNQPKDSRNSTHGQTNPQDNSPIPAQEQLPNLSQTVKTANAPLQSDTSTDINKQIQESIYLSLSQGQRQITVRLNPPELGTVTIKLQERDGQITGLLEVGKSQTKYEIEQTLPQLIQNLQNTGVAIKRINITLTDQSEQQTFKEQLPQDNAAGHHTANEGRDPNNADTNEWFTKTELYQNSFEPDAISVTENSINILV